MAELETDLGKTPEGYKVNRTSVTLLKLGDGLSKAVSVEPILVHAGDKVYFAVEAVKVGDSYIYTFDEDGDVQKVELNQKFNALGVSFVDEAAVAQAIARTQRKIADAEALKKSGQGNLLRTCVRCGWKEGQDPEMCTEGVPLHDFTNPLTINDVGDADDAELADPGYLEDADAEEGDDDSVRE